MAQRLLGLLALAAAAAALEPREIYERAAPATVFLVREGGTASGTVLDTGRGLILTNAHVVEGVKTVRLRVKDGAELDASVRAVDRDFDLALLEAPGLAKTGARAVALAPPLRDAEAVKAARVYAIGHPGDPTDALSMWKFTQGIVSNVRALALPRLRGLVLVEHDATIAPGNSGGPLLDEEARLLGVNMAGWAEISTVSANTYYAIPVNAVRRFLAEARVAEFAVPGEGTLAIFDERAVKPLPAEPGAQVEKGRGLVPENFSYGLYTHFLTSKEKASLKRRLASLFRDVRGLHYKCPTCDAEGTLQKLVQDGFWLDEFTWVPPVYQTITCPTCEGRKELFRQATAEQAFATYARAEKDRFDAFPEARDRFVARLYAAKRNYGRPPRVAIDVDGRHATVRGPRGDPLFPLRFKLLPEGTKYEWFLHDPDLNGPFAADPSAAGTARIAEVAAGDLYVLDDGTVVRLCGVCVPGADGKAPPPDLTSPDRRLRDLARGELLGKSVTLHRDKYTERTCGGIPLVYVEVDGKDYGEDLLRRGLVRRHPKHKCARHYTYMKAETEAKKAKAGIWEK